MENFANDIAAKMGNILSSKEHQNLFKKASDQTCCNNDCKCGTVACPCKKDNKTCSKSCGACSSKKEAMQNVLSRLLRLSEALDQQGFEKQASTVLKVFAALHHFDSMQELTDQTLSILDLIKSKTKGSDVVTVFKMIEQMEKGHLLPVIEKIPSLARKYKIELPPGFAAGAMNFLEEDFKSDRFLEGRGEEDALNADDSNDLRLKDLSKLHSKEEPFESLSAEIEELESDPEYEGPIDEGLPISLMERGIDRAPTTMRGDYQRNEIDRFLEGDGEDELSADDCGEIRLPSAEKSPRVDTAEQDLITLLGDEPIEDIDSESFDDEEFQRFLEGEGPETDRFPGRKEISTLKSPIWEEPLADTEPARVGSEDFPSENSPYSFAMKPRSLEKYKPSDTLRSSAFMKLDKYFKKDAKVQLPEKVAKWLSTAAGVVLKNSGKKFSEKEQSLFKKLSEAAKSGNAKPKHLNKLIAFCEEHKLNVHPEVRELAKTASEYSNKDQLDTVAPDFDFEDEEDYDSLSDDEEKLIKKTMRRIWNSEDFQEKLEHAIEPLELSTELAEETAIEMDHPEWLDDPDHEIFNTAYEILEDERFENPKENEYEDFY